MVERISEQFLEAIKRDGIASPIVKAAFIKRIKAGGLSREENPYEHFGVFFAPIDFAAKKVFIGHHIKSGLWLFNGGHLAQGELPLDTAKREMEEEWGENYGLVEIHGPELLTITPVNIPQIKCRKHFDIWFFVNTDERNFSPQIENLAKEFYQWGWMRIDEARRKVLDYQIQHALAVIEARFSI